MTSTVLKIVRPALVAAGVLKKPAPLTVDSVLGALNRTIVDLDAVREAKALEADKHKADALNSTALGAAAVEESRRAAAAHANISKLVA